MLKLKCNTTNVRPEIAAVVAAALNQSYWMNDEVKCIVRHNSIEFSLCHSSLTVDIEFDRQTNKYEVCCFVDNVADETVIMDSPESIMMAVMDTFF